MALIKQILHEQSYNADATATVTLDTAGERVQLVLNSGTTTAGTATITAKSVGAANYETVYDQFGAALTHTFTASTSKTFVISSGDGVLLSNVKVETSGMNGTYTVSVISLA